MATLNDLKQGNAYNLSFFASRIWPNLEGAVYDGTLGYGTASSLGPMAKQHSAALAYLPSGTPTDPTRLTYVVFLINGVSKAFAWEWINPTTIKETQINIRTVVIPGATAANDQAITMALQAAGFRVSSIS